MKTLRIIGLCLGVIIVLPGCSIIGDCLVEMITTVPQDPLPEPCPIPVVIIESPSTTPHDQKIRRDTRTGRNSPVSNPAASPSPEHRQIMTSRNSEASNSQPEIRENNNSRTRDTGVRQDRR